MKDGGPAFPLAAKLAPDGDINSYWTQHHQPGMSLRDWFAGQALAGFLANGSDYPFETTIDAAQSSARAAYVVADAMLAQREKSP